jgi:DNA-binding NtrC family response regulator
MSCRSLDEALFGGDASARPGLVERARGGTLLIDEPAALDNKAQLALLRALDRVATTDDTDATTPAVRVMASTSSDLEQIVERGSFRQDLYFRLCGARLDLPPLRRRRSDIPLLAAHFFARHAGREALIAEFLDRYQGHDWPGNVRELALAVERFALLGSAEQRHAPRASTSPSLERTMFAPAAAGQAATGIVAEVLDEGLAYAEAKRRVLDVFERAYVAKVLRENDGVVTRAAAASGLARRYFQILRARVES